jgi:putative sporulation protein YtxC
MIYEFTIATAHNTDSFLQELDNRLRWIKQRGYELEIRLVPISAVPYPTDSQLLHFCLHGKDYSDSTFRNEDIIYIFKHQLAEVLAEHIVNDWESKLLWREIYRTYRKSSPEDRQSLYLKAGDFLRRCHQNESLNLLMNFVRKNRISHRILEHINENDFLAVEGFINFCMKEYLTEIKFAVEVAAEELKNEKEYNDFVNLLRYFVDTQAPRIKEVNLLLGNNGLFYLWDHTGCKIEEQYMQHYLDDLLLDDVSLDDLLVSILITIAPRKIIIHNAMELPRNESVEIIKQVFEDKIVFCRGCKRCARFLCEIESGRQRQYPRLD